MRRHFRWRGERLFIEDRIAGDFLLGFVQQHGPSEWSAWGIMELTGDSRIGGVFNSEDQAKEAVEEWVLEQMRSGRGATISDAGGGLPV